MTNNQFPNSKKILKEGRTRGSARTVMVRLVVENILLFVFLALIPTQMGRHYWMEWSTVAGVRSDYLSPTLYIIDLVWIGWIIFNLQSSIGQLRIRKNEDEPLFGINKKKLFWLLGCFVIVGLNVWEAENRGVAGYRWLRIGQWLATVWLLGQEREKVWKYLGIILPVWIIGEAGLGMAQVAKNGSLQGLFYWLGERKFDYMTIGVATMSWMNEVRVRAYGTFSHPNSLAGFLLIAMILQSKITKLKVQSPKERIIYWVAMIAGGVGVLLAGSRVVWIVGAALLIFSLQSSVFSKRLRLLRYGGFAVLAGTGLWLVNNSSGWDTESWGKRVELMKAAGEMIKQAPLLGVGAGNFVGQLPHFIKGGVWWIQPVHNIFVLGLSEIGVMGVGMMGWILGKITNSNVQSPIQTEKTENTNNFWQENWMVIAAIGVTGMVDHYWLTLPQNSWLLAVVAAII